VAALAWSCTVVQVVTSFVGRKLRRSFLKPGFSGLEIKKENRETAR